MGIDGKPYFCILGRLMVLGVDSEVRIPQGLQQQLLALLIIHRENPLSDRELVDALWPNDLRAKRDLQTLIHALRGSLEPGGRPYTLVARIAGRYQICLEDAQIDAETFVVQIGQAERLPLEDARSHLRGALKMWRGEPAPEIRHVASASSERQRLKAVHASAALRLFDLDLAAGAPKEALPEMEGFFAQHPFVEPRALMQAYVALGEFGQAEQLYRGYVDRHDGLEPSAELQSLYRDRVLGARPSCEAASHDAVWNDLLRTYLSALRRGYEAMIEVSESHRDSYDTLSLAEREAVVDAWAADLATFRDAHELFFAAIDESVRAAGVSSVLLAARLRTKVVATREIGRIAPSLIITPFQELQMPVWEEIEKQLELKPLHD